MSRQKYAKKAMQRLERQRQMNKEIKPDGYKLRMILSEWFLVLFKDGIKLDYSFGPFTYREALEEAAKSGLPDIERAEFRKDGT